MKKVLTFAGSNSKNSINKQLANYAAENLQEAAYQLIDLNDFPLPIYSIDLEQSEGIPEEAVQFNQLLEDVDGVIIALAEHNGAYTAVFKNLYDWLSRIDKAVWKNKPMLLLATSPGGRGGIGVLTLAKNTFPRMGAQLIASFSLPGFLNNFKDKVIIEDQLNQELVQAVQSFEAAL